MTEYHTEDDMMGESLEGHLNRDHSYRLNDLMGMSWDDQNEIHAKEHAALERTAALEKLGVADDPSGLGDDLNPKLAANVLAHFGLGGYPCGSFGTKLIDAMVQADSHNLARLSIVYPGLGEAVRLYKNDPEGVAKLTALSFE